MKQEIFAFPIPFSQQRLWFLEQLTPGRAVYNICRGLRIKGRLDIGALEHSLNEIVRRHEVMRTTFSYIEGEPVQIVSPPFAFKLPIENLRHIPESQYKELAKQRLTEVARLPFDLARGPLFRVLLLQLDEDNYIAGDGLARGYLNRPALPIPSSSTVEMEEDYVAPTTPMEKVLAEIWQEILGVERVSVHDNFFDFGGHSLKVMEVISKLEERIGLRINPMELMMQNLGQVTVVCEKNMKINKNSS